MSEKDVRVHLERSPFPRKYKEQEEHSVSISITFSFRNASPLEQCASVEDWCRAWARHSREPKPYDEERRCNRAKDNDTHLDPSLEQTTYGIVDKIAHVRSVNISKSRQTTMKVRGNGVGSKNRTEIGIEIITRLRPGTIDEDQQIKGEDSSRTFLLRVQPPNSSSEDRLQGRGWPSEDFEMKARREQGQIYL